MVFGRLPCPATSKASLSCFSCARLSFLLGFSQRVEPEKVVKMQCLEDGRTARCDGHVWRLICVAESRTGERQVT